MRTYSGEIRNWILIGFQTSKEEMLSLLNEFNVRDLLVEKVTDEVSENYYGIILANNTKETETYSFNCDRKVFEKILDILREKESRLTLFDTENG